MKRFKDKYQVDKESGCWIWTAATFRHGYGQFKVEGKAKIAHRVSYELYKEPIPEGMCICHTCDNPSCVNPDHLFLGNHADNMKDKVNKGRQVKGEQHGNCKLSDQQVLEIRDLYSTGEYTLKTLSSRFNVSYTQINYIVNKKSRLM